MAVHTAAILPWVIIGLTEREMWNLPTPICLYNWRKELLIGNCFRRIRRWSTYAAAIMACLNNKTTTISRVAVLNWEKGLHSAIIPVSFTDTPDWQICGWSDAGPSGSFQDHTAICWRKWSKNEYCTQRYTKTFLSIFGQCVIINIMAVEGHGKRNQGKGVQYHGIYWHN